MARRAGTEQLRGHKLEITLEASGEVALDFLADGAFRWRGLPGLALDASGTPVRSTWLKAAPEVLLIVVMLPARERETMSIVLDQTTHHALFIASRLGEDSRPFERKTRVTQRFTNGPLRGSQPPPMPTRDLIGTRAIYGYSEDTVYEHIYLNSRWYSY